MKPARPKRRLADTGDCAEKRREGEIGMQDSNSPAQTQPECNNGGTIDANTGAAGRNSLFARLPADAVTRRGVHGCP